MGFEEHAVVMALEVCGDKADALELLTEEAMPLSEKIPPLSALQQAFHSSDPSEMSAGMLQGLQDAMHAQMPDSNEAAGDEHSELATAIALSMGELPDMIAPEPESES